MTDGARTYGFRNKHGNNWVTPLVLTWEASGDSISDNYTPEDITAEELWSVWLKANPEPVKGVSWYVTSPEGNDVFEGAPFTYRQARPEDEDFLTFFSWPVDMATGERLQWARLPVLDKLWDAHNADKGGFIQQATGWKPAPFQTTVDTALLAQLSGLRHP